VIVAGSLDVSYRYHAKGPSAGPQDGSYSHPAAAPSAGSQDVSYSYPAAAPSAGSLDGSYGYPAAAPSAGSQDGSYSHPAEALGLASTALVSGTSAPAAQPTAAPGALCTLGDTTCYGTGSVACWGGREAWAPPPPGSDLPSGYTTCTTAGDGSRVFGRPLHAKVLPSASALHRCVFTGSYCSKHIWCSCFIAFWVTLCK
jgi:hypothetical protein